MLISHRPQGVGEVRQPPLWLKDGDIVEVSLEGVGTCVNKVQNMKGSYSTEKASQ